MDGNDAARTLSGVPDMAVNSASAFCAVTPERPGRMRFGADCPVRAPEPDIDDLLKPELTDADCRKIFRDNAGALCGGPRAAEGSDVA